ncbi:MAG: SEC-C domain-containing protein [Sulfuritalea sp.]|nr:SEC-C domain-containing protein [Sulfuritalea sp.]
MQTKPDGHSHAATLLDDPLILDWALRYYRDLPASAPLRKELAATWFHDINLRRWLGEDGDDAGDPDTVEARNQLIRSLPETAFVNFAATLANRWSTWPVDAADPISRVVATIDPDRAAQAFAAYLEHPSPLAIERVWAIAANLGKLRPAPARALFEHLLPLTYTHREPDLPLLQQSLFPVAVRLNRPEELPRLFDGFFTDFKDRQQLDIEFVAKALFGHVSYARAYFWRRSVDQAPTFASLAPLFQDGAPLTEIDTAVEAETPLPLALALLETHHRRLPASAMAWELIQRSQSLRDPNTAVALAGLALAAVAAAFERSSSDVRAMPVDDALALLTMNVDTNIHYAPLLEVVRDLPQPEVTASAIRHLESSRDGNGGIAVARLMGDLGWSEFVSPLLACLEDSNGDFLCEAAADALQEIGEPARDELIARWDDLDRTQRIYGGSVVIRVGGTPVADFVLRRSDELMQQGAEEWCHFVLAAPDRRVVELVRSKLPLDHPVINAAAYCLLRLLADDDPALPGLRKKVMLRRARYQRRRNPRLGDDAFPSDKLELELRCVACNDVNLYDVGQVIHDPAAGSKAYLIADEFPCKACGEIVDFELEANARMALIAEALRLTGAVAAGIKPDSSRIAQVNAVASDGSVQSINSAFRQLRENVRVNPKDWLSWHRLSNINVSINRPRAALACARQAYALNPLLLEIIYNVAARLQEAGQAAEALDLLNSALKRIDEWTFQSIFIKQEGIDFAELYNELRHETGRTYLPALHPGFIVGHAHLAPKEAGRNDPCPCGSGKKYKKCCLR